MPVGICIIVNSGIDHHPDIHITCRSDASISDREWEAIQAGAISENKLTQILNNTNIDVVRQKATPRATTSLSTAKQGRISALSASGYSTSEIAEALGVSTSTVSKYLNGKE